VLADIWLGDLHLNQWLLDEGLAVPYGGTAGLTKVTDWEKDLGGGGKKSESIKV